MPSMTSAVARRRQIWTAPGESPCTHIDSTVAVITEPSIGNHFAAADHRGYALRNRIRFADDRTASRRDTSCPSGR